MKTIIFLLIILITIKCIGQESYFISFGLDPKLAIKGAYEHDRMSVWDISFKTGVRFHNNIESGLGIEYASLTPEYLSSNIFVNKVIPNISETIFYSFGFELLMIARGRFGSKKINPQYTFGTNSEIRIVIVDGFQVGFNLNLVHRKELKIIHDDRVFLKINGQIRLILETKR